MSNPLAARFAGELVLVGGNAASERISHCLELAVAHPAFAAIAERADSSDDDFWPQSDDRWGCFLRPYVVQDGILQIPVKGVLLHDFPYALGDWATGYEYIWQAFKRGCGDFATGTIKAIALIEDSPGGMVAGCFDAVDKMVALKEELGVPVRAFAHESAYSAAYAIATVADHIVVSRTGGVGSIGVVTSHYDLSAMYEKMGVKITFIASDPSKVEGNSTQPLSDDAEARIQVRIDELYEIFVAAVSRSRGLSADVIRGDLKAYCYTATQAVSNGLADSIGSLEDATSAFADSLDDPSDSEGNDEMAEQATSTVDQAVHEQAVADAATASAAAMQTRIGAILGSAEAEGREAQAKHIAFNTSMSAEDAIAMLAASAKAEAPKADEPASFADAMGKGNPDVGAEGAEQRDDKADADGGDIMALARSIGLHGVRPAAK